MTGELKRCLAFHPGKEAERWWFSSSVAISLVNAGKALAFFCFGELTLLSFLSWVFRSSCDREGRDWFGTASEWGKGIVEYFFFLGGKFCKSKQSPEIFCFRELTLLSLLYWISRSFSDWRAK